MLPFSSENLPASHVVLLRQYETELHTAYAAGQYEPIILPYHWSGFLFVVIYLLLEPSRSRIVYYYRFLSFFIFLAWSVRCVRYVRSPTPHITYGVGLINAWAIMLLAALIIFNDIKTFRRIWAIRDAPSDQHDIIERSTVNGEAIAASASGVSQHDDTGQQHRQRTVLQQKLSTGQGESENRYYWQPCPRSFAQRLNWLFDLASSMRGSGWQHQIRSIPAPPQSVLDNLPKPHPTARPTVGNYTDRRSLLQHSAMIGISTYLLMDLIKNVMMRDPYFWGFIDGMPLPTHPLAQLQNALLIRAYRLAFTVTMIGTVLLAIFNLNALCYVGICGPNRFPYLRTRADPWIYANWYGSFVNVLDHGLEGWWGSYWHQIFRLGFAVPGMWLCDRLGWSHRSEKGKIAAVLIAFSLSGALHAMGSYTTFPKTRPLMGSFMFFFLQGFGVLLETMMKRQIKRLGVPEKAPQLIKRSATLLWVLTWMLLTGPFLADDFARSGVWLFEPVPFSVVRLVGYGMEGQGAWTWHGRMCWWHRGERWWQSGIAF